MDYGQHAAVKTEFVILEPPPPVSSLQGFLLSNELERSVI
jgi:hypothetical protein